MQKIILASQSSRRKQLLQWAEVPFDVIIKKIDESYPQHLTPHDVAIHVAKNKALAIKFSQGDSVPILSADTIVVLNEEIIGKPINRDDAIEILSKLSNKKEIIFADTTEVEFHDLSMEQIIFYVDKYNPYDKAGAYAIQEWIGVVGIRSINGDFYNVMGLPVSRIVKELNKLNYS